ncbi:ATP-binding protein [Streptomyces flavotricini]|uniref:ATP-binding protein n=1 Tax=Streptomyces flavotricini TaxID=66888 RepID=A0ABS8DYX5_9ACTN|nr:ATP-binding protein [Streptomyces flavotricini]MCC0093562.1 ATP-binding protein [Streptomyces flavotricini]
MATGRSPEMTRHLALDGAAKAVTRCRDFTRQTLAEWGWPPVPVDGTARSELTEDALLLVSEVIANACLHAGGPTSLVLRCTPARLRIEVTDRSPAPPRTVHRSDPSRPGGHGLLIVERLGRDWGWGPAVAGPGKCVWVEIGPR